MRDLLDSIWQFFSELSRRNVYQVGITYVVVGFAVIEVADLTFVRLGLPPWTATLVVVLVGLGFPIALVLAWALEVTPEGVRRTPSEGEAVSGEGRAKDRTAREGSPAGPGEPEETEPGIAVLPFEDMSPEGDQQYFGDGLAEELLDALASIEGLRVAARTSSYAFRDDPAPVQQIGEQLGVSHLLEGSVRKAGDQLRVTAQLVDASDGYHVWSDTYDRTASDVFEIQDEITRSVVGNLEGILLARDEGPGTEQAARVEAGTDDPEAHDLYLKGKYYWNHRSRFGLESAIECFEEAIEVDPEFAHPYAGLAAAYTIIAVYRLKPPGELRAPTREAIDRALKLEPELAGAWHSEGLYRAFFDAEWEAAVSALRRAAELDPNSGRHAVWVGFLGLHLPAPPDDVHEQLSRAEQLEPRSNYVIAVLGLATMLDRRYDDTVEFGDRALEIEPEAFFSWFVKGVGHIHRGDEEAGLDALERMVELAHRTPFSLSLLGSAAAQAGHPGRTRSILRELKARSEEEFVAPLHTGMLKAALGRVDPALEDLKQERAEYGAGSFTHLLIHIWPALEEDRRYREMLEEVGLRLPRA